MAFCQKRETLLSAIRFELVRTSVNEVKSNAEIFLNGETPTRLESSARKPSTECLDPFGDLPLSMSASLGPQTRDAQIQNEQYKGRKDSKNDDYVASSDDLHEDSDDISSEKIHALEANDKDLLNGVSREIYSPGGRNVRPAGEGVHPTVLSAASSVNTSSLIPENVSKEDDPDLAPVSLNSSIARTKSFIFKNTVPSDKEMDAFGFQSQLDSDDYFSSDSELSSSGEDGSSPKWSRSLTLYAENSWHQAATSNSSPSRYSKPKMPETKSSSESKGGREILFTKEKAGSSLMQKHSNLTDLLNENFGLEDDSSNVPHNDKALRCLIAVPRLAIGFENPIQIKVDESFAVEDVVQTSLSQIRRLNLKKGRPFAVDLDSKLWNLYLADDDGQIDDDMGPLERDRLLISYCADEFVLDFKSKDDNSRNISRGPGVANSSAFKDTTDTGPGSLETLGSVRIAPLNSVLHATSIGSGITFDDRKTKCDAHINSDTRPVSGKHSQQESAIEPMIMKASDKAYVGNDMESINETVHPISSHQVSRRKKKFQTLLQLTGLNGNEPHISGANQGDSQNMKDRGYLGSGTYYRWTIWRRQQMSFKGRYPKSLVIDGHQVYILPFNESKGSWYESKTTSFDFNQIIKVKQNPRIPHYFKIVVMKQNHEAPKTYHLEAANATESRVIVKTFNLLMEKFVPTNGKT
ncbi:hypothetical protein KL947_005368 [Ogataea haglerorum]|nr:hypothetical protein KL947_005368 [Ogataea haglerorum]